jgi:alpha-L-arabinofuranosidase
VTTRVHLELEPRAATTRVSAHLYGLFIEDINFTCDGGLNANLVNNHSFEGVYAQRGSRPFASEELTAEIGEDAVAQLVVLTPAGRLVDRARHWEVSDGGLDICGDAPLVDGAYFARMGSDGNAILENDGYPGDTRSMALTGPLTFAAWVRADRYQGDLEVRLVGADGGILATKRLDLPRTGWQRVTAALTPSAASRGALQLALPGAGTLDLDEITLIPDDHWRAGDPRWSQGLLRRDIVEAMRDLAPRFIRFPGGCLVEGCGDGGQYKWKETLGPIERRRPEYNMWGQFCVDGDYSQSNQIGFYEYFLLCEDLAAEPIPVVWAGVACQVRADVCLPLESEEFAAVVQDAVDLMDWATGDPSTNVWAALRAEAGHPEPFALNYFAIGNENHGPDYRARFEAIRDAVEARRPGMSVIISTSAPDAPDTADTWAHARDLGKRAIVDEHFYYSAEWMKVAATRYDDYPRDSARVFIGEWSAFPPRVIGLDRRSISTIGDGGDAQEPNTWASALAEAAFLTGVERNSDVVALASYAPLLTMADHGQWAHNLIEFTPTEVGLTVNYLVQRLFATNLGEWIVPIAGTLPDDVFASATADDETVYLKLVNAGGSAVEAIVQLDAAADRTATCTRLHGSLTAANRLTFEGVTETALTPEEFMAVAVGGEFTVHLEAASVVAIRVPRG